MLLGLISFLLLVGSAEDHLARLTEYVSAGQLDQAREAMRQSPDESKAALQALIGQFDASIHSFRGKPEQRRVQFSQQLLETGIRLGGLLADLTGEGSYLRRFEARRDRMAATRLLNEKQFQQALDLAHSVRKTALELEDRSFVFSTYLTTAYAYFGLGAGDKGLADCQASLQIARETEDPAKMALALFNLGTAYLHLRRTSESLPYSMQAAEAAAKVGNKLWEANAWLNVAGAEMMRHNYDPAEKALQDALRLSKEVGDKLAEGRSYYDLGVLYHNWERWEAASDNLERSLPFIREVDIRHSHDIDEFNYVERDALELLVHSYDKMNKNDAAVSSARARLQELKAMAPKEAQPHSH